MKTFSLIIIITTLFNRLHSQDIDLTKKYIVKSISNETSKITFLDNEYYQLSFKKVKKRRSKKEAVMSITSIIKDQKSKYYAAVSYAFCDFDHSRNEISFYFNYQNSPISHNINRHYWSEDEFILLYNAFNLKDAKIIYNKEILSYLIEKNGIVIVLVQI